MQFVQNADLNQPPPDMPPPDMGPGMDKGPSMWDEKQYLDVLKHYSEDETIPQDLRSREWAVFGKAMVNTFLDEKDLPMIDIFGQILRIDEMWGKPAHLLNFKEVNDLDKMQVYMFLTAKRAMGISNNKMNERVLQNTQISQSIAMQQPLQKKRSAINPMGWF